MDSFQRNYTPCAIALIGSLPSTLADRSVSIKLQRRRWDEPIEPLRFDRTEHLDQLARKAARWAADNAERLRHADPEMPADVFNRMADNWRPLLAIADAAAGEWPMRARQAIQRTADGEQSIGELLRTETRTNDFPCRYGGEEFAVLPTETNLDDADSLARNLQERIAGLQWVQKRNTVGVTASFGVACTAQFANPDAVLRPGGFGRVRIQNGETKGALLIPQPSVMQVQSMYQVLVVVKMEITDQVVEKEGLSFLILQPQQLQVFLLHLPAQEVGQRSRSREQILRMLLQ